MVHVRYTHLGTAYEKEEEGTVSVVEGDSLWMTCDHQANPPARLVWRIGKLDANVIIGNDEEILLANMTRESAASYSCTAENRLGSNTAEITIRVLCEYTYSLYNISLTHVQTHHAGPLSSQKEPYQFLSKKVSGLSAALRLFPLLNISGCNGSTLKK